MSHNPHAITREFEKALCDYTGAPYAVAVNSCTMALLLAVAWRLRPRGRDGRSEYARFVNIPKRTYVSVPQAIIHAGGRPIYRNEKWRGAYELKPLGIWDSARWFTKNLYKKFGGMVAVSFHATKTLGDSQGGAILHDNAEADAWFRRARFDGRAEGVAPKDDDFNEVGWHAYLSPDISARLLWKLGRLPKHNDPLPNDDYPDLSKIEAFQ